MRLYKNNLDQKATLLEMLADEFLMRRNSCLEITSAPSAQFTCSNPFTLTK
jgi:hypothetical protein